MQTNIYDADCRRMVFLYWWYRLYGSELKKTEMMNNHNLNFNLLINYIMNLFQPRQIIYTVRPILQELKSSQIYISAHKLEFIF